MGMKEVWAMLAAVALLMGCTGCQPPRSIPLPDELAAAALADVDAAAARYGRSLLEGESLEFYDRLDRAVVRMDNFVPLEDLSLNKETLSQVFQYYALDNPDCFWLGKGYQYRYYDSQPERPVTMILSFFDGQVSDKAAGQKNRLESRANRERIRRQQVQLEEALEEIVAQIPALLPDREQAILAHDLLVKRIAYDGEAARTIWGTNVDSHAFSAYGALVEGKAVCEGYAEAYQLVLERLGIPCLAVLGDSRGQAHQWNLVELDGRFYHADLTWDDTDVLTQKGILCQYYLLMDDEQILRDHSISRERGYPLPSCDDNSQYAYLDTAFVVREGLLAVDPRAVSQGIRDRQEGWAVVILDGATDSGRVQRWVNTNLWGNALPAQALEQEGLAPSTSYYTISTWGMALVPLESLPT